MNAPHSQPLAVRMLQRAAAGAGIARLAVKQRTLRPSLPQRKRRTLRG